MQDLSTVGISCFVLPLFRGVAGAFFFFTTNSVLLTQVSFLPLPLRLTFHGQILNSCNYRQMKRI